MATIFTPKVQYWLNFCGEVGTVTLLAYGIVEYHRRYPEKTAKFYAKIKFVRKLPLEKIVTAPRKLLGK